MLKLTKLVLHLLPYYLTAMTAYANQANDLLSLPTPHLNWKKQATLLKPVAPQEKISFIIWLKLRNKNELDQLAQDVYDPNSSRYHQFLTRSLYEQKFAPSKDMEETLQQFLISQGMQTKVINDSLRVIGTVDQIKQTFHAQINYYQYKNEIVYANSNAPKLNHHLGQYISEITGLNTNPQFRLNTVSSDDNEKKEDDSSFIWNNFAYFAQPTIISLQGFSGEQLQTTYNLNNIPAINGVQINGAGQTLVVVDECGKNGRESILRDTNTYFKNNKIIPFKTSGASRNFAIINSDGTPFTKCPGKPHFSREILLDLESSHTIAPGDNTVLVLGPDPETTIVDVIHMLIKHKYTIAGFSNAYVISNSWHSPETKKNDALESQLELAAAAGISVNFSSGDCGDNTYKSKKCTPQPESPIVNYPSSSAYVTAVGATALFVDNNYNYAFETVWGGVSQDKNNNKYKYDGGTGGGISKFYGPVSWQRSIRSFTAGGYGVIADYKSRRALPDVAMLGDPKTGLLIIAKGKQVRDGGTSLACPLFSATLVLVNQARHLLHKKTQIGQAAPYLYHMNYILLKNRALNLIIPPATVMSEATPPPSTVIDGTPAPASAFTIQKSTFGWDSSLTIEPEDQFWNDAVGVGSLNIPNFVKTMSKM